MKLIMVYDNEKQVLELNDLEVEQLSSSLSLDTEGLSRTERDRLIQEAVDERFNRPDYNNSHKYNRRIVPLGVKSCEGSNGEGARNLEDPLMKSVYDARIFRADELALEERDSYESIYRQIRSALKDKPKWAEAFIAVRLSGVSVNDYAASIGVSDASVVSHWLKRAKNRLNKYFQNRQI